MHPTEFLKDAKGLVDTSFTIMEQANAEYASDADKFENFKTIAAYLSTVNPRLAQLQAEDVALIYFMKHLSSIVKGISNRESMDGRYADAINYLLLHRGIVSERANTHTWTVTRKPEPESAPPTWVPNPGVVFRATQEFAGDSVPVYDGTKEAAAEAFEGALEGLRSALAGTEPIDAREGTGNEDFVPGGGVVPPFKAGENPWR